ncbi:MAG: tetratricopeptide repeat protein [Xenococcaceae cyanobacterium]
MSRNFTSCLVQLSPCPGVDINAYLVLNKKPTRQEQKLKTLKQYIKQYSSGWKKRLELADLLYEMGQWSEAVREYRQVIKGQPQLIKPRIQLGKILQLMNRKAEGIAVYESALAKAKNEATRQHLVGLIEFCKGNSKGAIAAFKSATTLEHQNLAHWMALGQIQMEAEHHSEALSTFETILSLDPNNLIGLIYSHDMLLALGNLPEAEKRLNQFLEVAPQDIQTLKRLITNRCRKRLVFDAEGKQTKKLINSLLKQALSSPEAHSLQAHYYILRGEQQKGINVLEQFTEEYSNNPHGWYYYSRCLFAMGKHEAASEAILKAYQLSSGRGRPCDREIYRAVCEILPATGRLDKTRSIITEMLECFPESWSVWATAGRVLVEHFQEIDLGCSYSLRGTTLQPELADAWLRHGRVLSLAGKHEEAIEALTQGWQLLSPATKDFKSVSAAVWLGESYQKLGSDRASQKWLKIACQQEKELIKFDPAKAHYWQSRALESLTYH